MRRPSAALQVFDGPGRKSRLLAYCWLNTFALPSSMHFRAERQELDKVRRHRAPHPAIGTCVLATPRSLHLLLDLLP